MTPVLKGAPNTFTNKSSAHPATFTNPGINPYNKITIIFMKERENCVSNHRKNRVESIGC